MDIPSLFMIPSAVSSGKVHSVFPNSTDADFDFNRDSDATRVNSEGLIERVGYYGSESVVNGNFDTDTNWTKTQSVIENGQAIITSPDGSYAGIIQNSILTSSKTYYYSINVISISGTMVLRAGVGTDTDITTSGVHTGYIVANGTGFEIKRKTGALSVVIDSVSLKQVNGDRARLNYEIEGGLVNTKPSLLLEPQSTNLITYSEDFSNSYWTKGGVTTVTANFASPDGQNNAYKLSGANGTDRTGNVLLRNFNTGNSTFSLYVKSLGSTKIRFYFRDGTTGAIVNSGSFSLTNEYQRLTFSHNVANLSNFYIGDTDGDVLIFGAQIEALTYATSYIPTNGSTQTRAAETCNGAGTSSIFDDSEGILYCEIAALTDLGSYRLISLSDGTSVSNRITILYNIADNQIYGQCVASSSTQAFVLFEPTSISDFHKIAFKYKANDFQLWVDGVKVGTDTSGSAPTGLSMLSFDRADGVDDWYGKVRDIRVYNTKEMTDSEVDILLTKITS